MPNLAFPRPESKYMPITEIAAALEALEANPALTHKSSFSSRAEAQDELEIRVLDRLADLRAVGATADIRRLKSRAKALQARFWALDQEIFATLRATIRAGSYFPASLRAQLLTLAGNISQDGAPATHYDSLDVLTNGLFPVPAQLPAPEERDPEMVYYQKTPARIILELAAKLTPKDVLYDLGSGLGQVPLLVQLLSGATARGIEIEPTYCRHAQACAHDLNLPQVQFQCADVRTADYADATAFYLFTPFTGHIMQQVLAQLQALARQRPLRLFSYGPSTEALRQQAWLQRLDLGTHLYQLAEFQSTQ
ncbi:class I SAM-dependent methyltransferase [Hymenobacter sp. BT18]|uniref:class I SAM-dependent methyltransferase n=1 Tax=Hymenobacter sp. BT18 TaxID=2835648 RepID=UPI00143E818C|nr:class I SAM-dependent methyltransferase [Hymenobacter sp. BT18]QIX62689.1 class I SAM-dependent methyltransferase [Hymenobacter sp. BT18]